jgi:hypothetical protein
MLFETVYWDFLGTVFTCVFISGVHKEARVWPELYGGWRCKAVLWGVQTINQDGERPWSHTWGSLSGLPQTW